MISPLPFVWGATGADPELAVAGTDGIGVGVAAEEFPLVQNQLVAPGPAAVRREPGDGCLLGDVAIKVYSSSRFMRGAHSLSCVSLLIGPHFFRDQCCGVNNSGSWAVCGRSSPAENRPGKRQRAGSRVVLRSST